MSVPFTGSALAIPAPRASPARAKLPIVLIPARSRQRSPGMETQADSKHPEQRELPLQQAASPQRRGFLQGSLALAASAAAGNAAAQWTPSLRYPDPNVVILDPSFAKYR